jgi:hypothetical protein
MNLSARSQLTNLAPCLTLFLLASVFPAPAQTSDSVATRDSSDINWTEFKEMVPSKTTTVLRPAGTMEADGVMNQTRAKRDATGL